MKTKLSPWMTVPGSPHCCMRIIDGTEPEWVENRVALIEKTPRVRIAPYAGPNDQASWKYGPKGSGGPEGYNPENELYGFYPPSRDWCDGELLKLGYELP